jgi:hypothetical protein
MPTGGAFSGKQARSTSSRHIDLQHRLATRP